MYHTVVIALHLLAATGVVLLVLLQQGKGAESGASFGAGASATVFGSQGASTFLSRFTAVLTAVFFLTSLALAYAAKQQSIGLSEVGLPSASAIEAQAVKPVVSDVPVLDAAKQGAPAAPVDVPSAPVKKATE